MKSGKYRRGIKHMNKYQKKIFLLAFIPCTLLILCMTCLLYIFFNDFGNALLNEKTIVDVTYVKYWSILILGSLWLFFVFLCIWVIKESNHLVGAFDRVKKELHDVSVGERKEVIIVRDKDHLFRELLENINVIVKNLYNK